MVAVALIMVFRSFHRRSESFVHPWALDPHSARDLAFLRLGPIFKDKIKATYIQWLVVGYALSDD